MTEQPHTERLTSLFAGNGEMAHLMRSHDWSQTPLGSVEHWPQSLRSAISILLPSKAQICLFWGPEFVTIYNDAYRPVLGTKHPRVLGTPASECWSEIWNDVLGPLFKGVIATGESFWAQDYPFLLARSDYLEETYFDISYDPVRDESGQVGGVFCIVNETTDRVLSERRLRTLRELTANTATTKDVKEACRIAVQTLAINPQDVPFALLYQIDATVNQATLIEAVGIKVGTPYSPAQIDLAQAIDPWLLAQVQQTSEMAIVSGLASGLMRLPDLPSLNVSDLAAVMPLLSSAPNSPSHEFLIIGISPRRMFDEEYRGFFNLVASNIATAISNARSYEAERQRAEALAEIDRAKTVFFSNVSHEFRTPLTLMLAPLEDALASLGEAAAWEQGEVGEGAREKADGQSASSYRLKEQLKLVQRNGKRLLKLVNTLLDFSRIEAGRIQSVYEPTDLATFTIELASTFRSLIERAGIELVVDCPPLPEAVYVDREMWEKIVLNLLSNAFKFTLSGTITIRLQTVGDQVNLVVEDTGIGIPPAEIPYVFERFHRVKESQGRSFEGSGIGLSLVQELVHLHGGNITVTSTVGQGSCFTVSIPRGTAHLPPDRIRATRTLASTATGVTPYVEEVLRWFPKGDGELESWEEAAIDRQEVAENRLSPPLLPLSPSASPSHARILVVDDNADMRNYLKHLLGQRYEVKTVEDGLAALHAIHQTLPDLVLADVMMPRLDGFGLLQELRTHPSTRELPIILLSARAGEEASIEGLEAGADDYLIKPFSNRELLARVEACLKLAQIRREAALREQALRLTAEHAQQETESTFARLTQLLESMSDAFVELDKDWRITYQNAAAERINLNKPRSQVIGKILWEEWPDGLGTEMERQYRRAMAEQVPVHFEFYYNFPPRFDVWLEIDAYPSESGLGIFFRDISDRKQAELTIREREEILQLFFKYVPTGIAMFDRQMHYLMASQRWLEDYNLGSVESVLGRSHYDIFPDVPERWRQIHQRCLAGAIERCEADCFERADGSLHWRRWEVRPWYQANQEIGGIIIFAEDITARKQTETALQESQLRLQQQLAEIEAIYQSAPIGLNVLDSDLRFVRINQRLAEMNGLSMEAHLGHTVRELLPDLADASEQLLRPILETGKPLLNVEITGETPAQPGVQRTWVESFLPLKDGDRVIGISTVCEEITERKQAEEALRRAKSELEIRVTERTLELQQANKLLQQELIRRSQVERELQDNVSSLQSLYQVIATHHHSFERRIQDLLTMGCQLFGLEFGILARVQNGQYQVMVVKSPGNALKKGDTFDVKQTLCCEVLDTDEPLTIEHAGVSQWRHHPAYNAFRMERYIGTRVLVDNQVYSTISFSSKTPAVNEFKPSHKELLKLMARWIGGEIERMQANDRLRQELLQRVQTEQQLRQSEEQRRLALDLTHLGFWDLHMPTGEMTWNDNHFTLLGLPVSSTSPRYETWRDAIHPDDVERVEQLFRSSIETRTDYAAEYRVVHPNGSEHWILSRGRAVYDDQNQPLRSLGVVLDISDRKQMEASLQESDRRWRSLLDNVQLVVIELDINGNVEYVNPFFLELTGYQLNEVVGQSWFSSFLSPGQQPRLQVTFREILERNFHSHYQNPILTKSGEERMIAWSNTLLRDPAGQPIGTISIGEDITERYKIERMKAEFISVVSHELRTPLTSMQAALSLLSEKIIDPTSAEGEVTIQIATEGTDRLVRLVNDILDLERLESGKVHLSKHPCDIDELVQTAIAQMQEMANQADITLEANACAYTVEADSDRILQVLTNLLSNAIKFSPNHSVVRLTVELQDFGETNSCLLFTIHDQGRGIPADNLESIFERFHQVDASDSREKGGTGLGLAICRSIIQQHGGEIWAQSTLNEVSTFYFTLPIFTLPTET